MVEETIKFISVFDITRAQDDNINAWFLSCVSRFLPQDILLVFPAFYDFSYVNNAREIQLKRSEADAYSILFDKKIKDSIIEHLSTRIGITESYCKSGLASSYLDAWINPDDTNEIQFAIRNFAELRLAVNIPIKTASVDRCERLVQMSYKELFSSVKGTPVAVQKGLRICCKSDSNPFEGDKRFEEGLLAHYCLLRSSGSTRHLYYFFPNNIKVNSDIGEVNKGNGGLFIVVQNKLAENDIALFSIVSFLLSSKVAVQIQKRKVQEASIRSAIGSIMSRNGSHNIGSHVLAALSHNVGTLPDDRVLYQYIQQRMDYIATVTTDFPTWTQPTMFVADMMKTFLSQRHLLDHIVESEGLHAFQFQNPNMMDEEWADQKNCVKIHIRRKKGQAYKELIDYTKRDAKVLLQDGSEEYDISLAIPGGIIGEHAFYTILENIIRNAAKHAWAPLSKEEKEKYGNLEIYIDFEDCDSVVKFTVYTKLPLKKEEIDRVEKSQNDCDVKTRVDKFDNSEGLRADDQKEFDDFPIDHRQKIMLARPFIDSQGALRRENWGLAEMKISAGYLAGKEVDAIGGLKDEKDEKGDIIEPCIIPCIIKEEDGKKEEDVKQYFGYKFSIAKPKEILIIVQSMDGWGDDNVRKDLERMGIFIRLWDEIKNSSDAQSKRLNYRYVVHYDANEMFGDDKKPKDGILPPFRILSGKESNYRNFIPQIDFAALQEAIENGIKNKSDSIKIKEEIEQIVYKTYLEHLKAPREIEGIGLLVAINENEKSGGNSLISDADILELMLEQNFAVCVDQYKAFAANEDNRKIIKCLESIRHRSSAKDKVIKFKHLSNKTIRELIAQRMCDWAGKSNDSWIPIVEHLRKKYFVSDVESKTPNELKPSNNEISVDFAANVNSLLQKHPIDDFIRYVESVFENTKKLFKQYEEQIVTLPAGYKVQVSDVEEEGQCIEGIKIITSATKEELEKEGGNCHWIGYRRHAHTIDGCKSLYVEPLSGTQTYLSQLTKVKDNLGLQMRLIENGLMRILVLDERVAKFLREHQKEVGPHYKAMNINVIDHECVEGNSSVLDKEVFFTGYTKEITNALEDFAKKAVAKINESVLDCKNVNNKPLVVDILKDIYIGGTLDVEKKIKKKFIDVDILIVHQGILDKWFDDLKSVEGMKYLLEGFKRLVKYVVVTTGRGTPVNIPKEAHLLPFAVVESTLFKKYPEKLILTDTIMNVLPVGVKANEGGE